MTNKRSSLKLVPEISRNIVVVGGFILFALGFYFFLGQIIEPPCCDANQYIEIANKYNLDGMLSIKEGLRTFGYPWLLSIIFKISHISNLPASLLVFLAQLTIYFLAIFFVANVASHYSMKMSAIIYLALCINIFVIPYAGVTLTDSLYVSISIMIFAVAMEMDFLHHLSGPITTNKVFLISFLLCLAITIRPASIWLVLPVFYCLARLIYKGSIGVFETSLALLFGSTPLLIQIVINVTNFHVVSFLPVQDLGGAQIKWGIQNIKYGTWLGGGSPHNYYPSSNLINATGDSLSWYLNNRLDACKLLFFKLIGAFDFDYLMPYPYHQPRYKWVVSFFSFTIFWLGIYGVFLHLYTNKLLLLGSRFMPLVIFISWCSVSLSSALELRFTLPLISYFIIVACAVTDLILSTRNKKHIYSVVGGWVVFMPVFYLVSEFIRAQSTVIQ